MTIFEFVGQFVFQNDVFKTPRKLFRTWNQSIPCEWIWKFPDISYFIDLRQARGTKKNQN
jgi:hypothetical protein